MELKYKENTLWKVIGSIWLIVGLMNLTMLVFMLMNELLRAFGLMLSPILTVTCILSFVLAYFYIKCNKIDYIRLDERGLSIHRSIILPRRNIEIKDIEQVRLIDNDSKLIFILKSDKEVEILLQNILIKDREQLQARLAEIGLLKTRYVLDVE